MQLAPGVADRITKLLRLLSSDREGEVVAAAGALQRTLRANGCDIHDLADLVVAGPTRSPRPAEDNWLATARWCHARSEKLNAREREFVDDMVNRVVFPSERQLKWLYAIHARLRGCC